MGCYFWGSEGKTPFCWKAAFSEICDAATTSGMFHKITEDGDYVIQMRVTRTGGSRLTPPFTPTLPKGRNFNEYVPCSYLCTQL